MNQPSHPVASAQPGKRNCENREDHQECDGRQAAPQAAGGDDGEE